MAKGDDKGKKGGRVHKTDKTRAAEFDAVVTFEMESDATIEADAEAAAIEALNSEPPLKPGRPRSVMTRETILVILRSIRLGMPAERAGLMAGVGSKTLEAFRKRNATFAGLVERAEALAEDTFRGRILKHSQSQWTAAAWLLERRFPERWARKDAPNWVETPQQTAAKIQAALSHLAASVPNVAPPAPPTDQPPTAPTNAPPSP
jgi:hypothetical protein